MKSNYRESIEIQVKHKVNNNKKHKTKLQVKHAWLVPEQYSIKHRQFKSSEN